MPHPLQPVFMVQSTKDRPAPNNLACQQMVAMCAGQWCGLKGHRDTRSKAHVPHAAIVVVNSQLKAAPEMPLTQRDQEI